jgi:hypothetical protein
MAEAAPNNEPAPQPATEAEFSIVKPGDVRDPNFYYLAKAIDVDGKTISQIRLNPKGIISGRDWFMLLALWKRKYPEEVARGNPLHRYMEEGYLSLVLAKINKITPEDLYKIDPEELPTLYTEARVFQFSGANKQTTE